MAYKSLWVTENKKFHDILRQYTDSEKSYPKGSFIYNQNEERSYLTFLLKGRVKVSISNQDGSEKTLAIHEPGSFLGETSFFESLPSFCSAKVLEDSVILSFDKEQITRLISEQPEIIFHLFQSMSRKIRLLSFQVDYLSFMTKDQSFVVLLLSLFDAFGKPCKTSNTKCKSNECIKGAILNLSITDQELGEMIGTRRESVTKIINKLKNEKLILKNKRIICCPNINKLIDFVVE